MEFIEEEIEVNIDADSECDTHNYRILKIDDGKSSRSCTDENMGAYSDALYFKFKLLVEELCVVFTKREDKCGVCVEYIVKLCQHIGDTHDSGHGDVNTSSNSSDPKNSESTNQITDFTDASTSCLAATRINTLGTETCPERNQSQNNGLSPEDAEGEYRARFASKRINSCTRPAVKNNKSQGKLDTSPKRPNKISCGTCGKTFPYRNRLEIHLLTHTGEKPFKCETCGKSFAQDYTLKEHSRIHTGDFPYKCDMCDKVFCYSNNLRTHRLLVKCKRQNSCGNERNVILKLHKCVKCGKMFRNMYALNAHGKVHRGKKHRFYCGVCGKGFFYNYLFVRHSSTHTDTQEREKQFHCGVCGKCFQYNSLLIRHRLTHTREKQFDCNLCGKIYLRKYDFDRHKLMHNAENQNGPI